jgi:predicted thioesterase
MACPKASRVCGVPQELLVGKAYPAQRIGSKRVHVLATPVMIKLREAAALTAAEHLLQTGYQSLGTRLEVSHVAARPVGMRVRASAKLSQVNGNRTTFRVEAPRGGADR